MPNPPRTETLYGLVHPERGLMYGLGTSLSSAWVNAILLAYLIEPENKQFDPIKKNLHKQGWRAKRVTVTYD